MITRRTSRAELVEIDGGVRMEPLWSPRDAACRNQLQVDQAQNSRSKPKPATSSDQLPFGAHGKEGVDGSSPSEGFALEHPGCFLLPLSGGAEAVVLPGRQRRLWTTVRVLVERDARCNVPRDGIQDDSALARVSSGGRERTRTERTVEGHHWRPPCEVCTPSLLSPRAISPRLLPLACSP